MIAFDTMIAAFSIIAGGLMGVWLHSEKRESRLTRGVGLFLAGPLFGAAAIWLLEAARLGDGPGIILFVIPITVISGALVVAGVFLLLRGPKPVHLS